MKRVMKPLSILLVLSIVFLFSGCFTYTSNILEVTAGYNEYYYNPNGQGTNVQPTGEAPTYISPVPETTTEVTPVDVTTEPSAVSVPETTQPSNAEPTEAPVSTTAPAPEDNPSAWSKEKTVQFLSDAVNRSKAYTANLRVDHTESFTINIEEISPNLPLITNLAQGIIDRVLKPTDEVLNYNNGRTVNTEGEDVPILLPKRQNFSLPVAGVAAASAQKSGENIVIDIKLVQENATLEVHPVYNSGTTGYLSVEDVDLSGLSIEQFDVSYIGSTLHAIINSEGYVVSCEYHMPVHITASGRALGLRGAFSCSGEQIEIWKLNW